MIAAEQFIKRAPDGAEFMDEIGRHDSAQLSAAPTDEPLHVLSHKPHPSRVTMCAPIGTPSGLT